MRFARRTLDAVHDLHGPTIGRDRSYDDVGVHAPN